jgi:uncharacterized membrane protein
LHAADQKTMENPENSAKIHKIQKILQKSKQLAKNQPSKKLPSKKPTPKNTKKEETIKKSLQLKMSFHLRVCVNQICFQCQIT